MRMPLILLALLPLAACSRSADPSPPTAPSDPYRILSGPAICDSCDYVRFQVAGPDLGEVRGAAFTGGDGHLLPIHVQLAAFTGDSGDVLLGTASFLDVVGSGSYPLRLTRSVAGGESTIVLGHALRVVRPSRRLTPPPDPFADPLGLLDILVWAVGTRPYGPFQLIWGQEGCQTKGTCLTGYDVGSGQLNTESVAPGRYEFLVDQRAGAFPEGCSVTTPMPLVVEVPVGFGGRTQATIEIACP